MINIFQNYTKIELFKKAPGQIFNFFQNLKAHTGFYEKMVERALGINLHAGGLFRALVTVFNQSQNPKY